MKSYLKDIKSLGAKRLKAPLGERMSDEWVADYIVKYIVQQAEITKYLNNNVTILIEEMPVSPTALKLIEEILEQIPLGKSVNYRIKVTPKNGYKKDYRYL